MLLPLYTNDRNGEQCFQENVYLLDSEKQARGPMRREFLATAAPLKPSGFVFFIMKNVKRKTSLKLDVAGHNKGIWSLMANVTCLFLVP